MLGINSVYVGFDVDHEEAQQGINVIGNGDFQNVIFGYIIMAHMGDGSFPRFGERGAHLGGLGKSVVLPHGVAMVRVQGS
ncbi:hypothetical protein MRX96_045091 [Rhipicephalus microplus]